MTGVNAKSLVLEMRLDPAEPFDSFDHVPHAPSAMIIVGQLRIQVPAPVRRSPVLSMALLRYSSVSSHDANPLRSYDRMYYTCDCLCDLYNNTEPVAMLQHRKYRQYTIIRAYHPCA